MCCSENGVSPKQRKWEHSYDGSTALTQVNSSTRGKSFHQLLLNLETHSQNPMWVSCYRYHVNTSCQTPQDEDHIIIPPQQQCPCQVQRKSLGAQDLVIQFTLSYKAIETEADAIHESFIHQQKKTKHHFKRYWEILATCRTIEAQSKSDTQVSVYNIKAFRLSPGCAFYLLKYSNLYNATAVPYKHQCCGKTQPQAPLITAEHHTYNMKSCSQQG